MIIEVANLTKEYVIRKRRSGLGGRVRDLLGSAKETKVAVSNISFDIEPGEAIGFVGPNGAGKSTTIKMLTGILLPTSGSVKVNGIVPWQNRKVNGKSIGVVFGQRTQLWWDLPVVDSFDILKYIYQIPDEVYKRNVDFFMDVLAMDEYRNTPVRLLSLGQRMRAEIASAFLHDPAIVYLDEPTIGLDVVAKERIREFLQMMNEKRNLTIILTTHDLNDIERVCRRMILINEGALAYNDQLARFKREYGTFRTLIVNTNEPMNDIQLPTGAEITVRDDKTTHIRFDRELISASQLLIDVAKQFPIVDCTIEEPTVETILRQMYEEGKASVSS